MPAVSKAQQRFMGMVHATQKGDMEAPSKEVEKVADTMKKVDAKDFASTKHKGLPTHVKEKIKEIIRGVMKAEGAFGSVVGGPEDGRNLTEMSPNDTHFKGIMAMYDKGGSFARKKVGAAVSKNPNASRNQIVDDLKDLDYQEILDAEAQLGLDETITEEFKHLISVDTPTQIVSKPIAAQILALAKKGVRSSEIGLKMGFVGNQKAATDAFQKVKNKIYFALDKRTESVNEGKLGDAWRKNNKKGYVLKVGNIELKSAGPTNSHDILVNREPWGSFMMDYEAGGNDWWVKPTRGKDFWVDSIDDLIKKIKTDSRFKESVSEALSKDTIVRTLTSDKNAYFLTKDGNGWILDITPRGAMNSTFHQKFTVKDMGKGHLGMKYKLTESEEHDCGCNENHDCGCGGLHTH